MAILKQYHDALQNRALARQDEQIGFEAVGPLLPRTVETLERLSRRGHAESSYMLGEHYLWTEAPSKAVSYLAAAWRQTNDVDLKDRVRQAMFDNKNPHLQDTVMDALSGRQAMQETPRYGTGEDVGPSAG